MADIGETIALIKAISGQSVAELKRALNVLEPSASASDVGKMLKVKTVADGKVTEYEFGSGGGGSDLPISLDETDFSAPGKNLFNGNRTDGGFVNWSNGTIASNDSYAYTTDFIEVEPNTAYVISAKYGTAPSTNGLMYAIYDSSKAYLTGLASSASFTTGATAKYVRFSVLKDLTSWQLEKGTEATEYEEYKLFLSSEAVWSDDVQEKVAELIDEKPLNVKPSDTTFFASSPNLFDPSTAVVGELVNQSSGAFNTYANGTRTSYIEVTPGKPYSFINHTGNTNQYIRYFFYKADKTPISGSGAYVYLKTFSCVYAPSNAKYIVVSFETVVGAFMVAESNQIPAYYPYSYTFIDPQYVISEKPNDIVLNIPAKMYATEGIEFNVYFENITEDWTKYQWDVECSIGKQMERGYTLTPTSAQAGTYDLSIIARAKDGIQKRANTSLIVTAKTAGDGDSVSVLVLGDSTTANGIAVSKLNANFTDDPMAIETVGTLGTAPNKHEGRSGWTFDQYFNTSSGNAFYHNSTFDAPYYFQSSGVSAPDWFFINLGINDVFNHRNDEALISGMETVIGLCDDMIESIKSASESIKVGVCLTIPPNHSQDSFGKAYACYQTRNRYKRNNTLYVKKLIEKYDKREDEGIYVVPIHAGLDTIYNMGMETLPVNARNTDMTYESPIQNGGVHPVDSGYWQIADVYTAFLKGNAT